MRWLLTFVIGTAITSAALVPSANEIHANTSVSALSTPLESAPVRPSSTDEMSRLLCCGRWIYEEYVRDFNSASKQVFKRNRKQNDFDLGQNWVQFFPDGHFDELNENGDRFRGEWHFLDDGVRIECRIPGTWHHNVSTIKVLTGDRFEWNDDNYDTYGEMTHPKSSAEESWITKRQ